MKRTIIFKRLFSLVILGALVASCQEDGQEDAVSQVPSEPIFEVDLPNFPAVALHVLEREYAIHSNKPNSRISGLSLDEYIEKRLLELYPDIAYEGMIKKSRTEIERLTKEYEVYLEELAAYEASIGIITSPVDEYVPFTTLENEIALTNMTQGEINLYKELEALASSDQPVDFETLNSFITRPNGQVAGGVISTAALLFASIPLIAWRVIQSKDRAEQRAEQFFSGLTGSGGKGDAFRHIFVSMHLRRYLSQPAAWAIMGGVELYRDIDGSNTPRDRTMDIHNNSIGFNTMYDSFRGGFFKDLNNYEKWSENVRNYVNNPSNGVKVQGWDNPNTKPATNSDARDQTKNIPSNKYNYYL